MRPNYPILFTTAILSARVVNALPTIEQQPLLLRHGEGNQTISQGLFSELEELARIVDISYCVGMTGVQKPFQCLGRCKDFPNFELVTTWNTGLLLSDSCGYIALDHSPTRPRILVAFRGTYSLANTIADLSTIPQAYVPYVGEGDETNNSTITSTEAQHDNSIPCPSCTVHMGFLRSWHNTRTTVIPTVTDLLHAHPKYSLYLVGHSLGGAVALLAGLEMSNRDWRPTITTFGEPRLGNAAFVAHVDERFSLGSEGQNNGTYRRVTHVDDPVPLLPLTEWGYVPHAGELYISKSSLPPDVTDIRQCVGDSDPQCIAGADASLERISNLAYDDNARLTRVSTWEEWLTAGAADGDYISADLHGEEDAEHGLHKRGLVPARYKLWQLFFAHRDYFRRLGVCLPGGDPWDWKGVYPQQLSEDIALEG